MALSALAFRSKAHWGYSQAFMSGCRDELTVRSEQIESSWVLQEQAVRVGFYTLSLFDGQRTELDFLFVEPRAMGRGVGRQLLAHAFGESRRLARPLIRIVSDPHAAGFYAAAGAVWIGQQASASIAGRMLPVYELRELRGGAAA